MASLVYVTDENGDVTVGLIKGKGDIAGCRGIGVGIKSGNGKREGFGFGNSGKRFGIFQRITSY